MRRCILYSGTELVPVLLPDEAELVEAPALGRGVRDVFTAVSRALAAPVDGRPLRDRVGERDRVLVVFDGPTVPAPPMLADPRPPALRAILTALDSRGVAGERVTLMCAVGCTRRLRAIELAALVGMRAMASRTVRCHDAEDIDDLATFGQTREGDAVELAGAVARADLVVSLSLCQAPLHGGYSTLVGGLASTATTRRIWSAKNLCQGANPFDPARSRVHRALGRMGKLVEKQGPVMHVELALDTRMWPSPILSMLKAHQSGPATSSRHAAMPGPLAAWNRIPEPLRARSSRFFASEYQVLGAFAGSTLGVRERTLQLLRERTYVKVPRQADVVMVGIPAVGPHTLGSYNNPILDVSTAFGNLLAWHQGRPLFRRGGVVILLAPLTLRFDDATHLPYRPFWDEVLTETRDPAVMAERYEDAWSGRPQYVAAYRKKHAYHGLHPFLAWYQGASTLAQAGKVVVVGADRDAAARLGFEPVRTLVEALAVAEDFLDDSEPRIAALAVPPAFGVSVGE